MPNDYLSVLYKHIIQVENENVGLKVGVGVQTYHCPPIKKVGGGGGVHMPPLPPRFLCQWFLCFSTNVVWVPLWVSDMILAHH